MVCFCCQVHRRLLHDDNRGVDEPLMELGQYGEGLVVRGKHLLVLDTPEASADVHRKLALQQYLSPQIIISTGQGAPYRSHQRSINQVIAINFSIIFCYKMFVFFVLFFP